MPTSRLRAIEPLTFWVGVKAALAMYLFGLDGKDNIQKSIDDFRGHIRVPGLTDHPSHTSLAVQYSGSFKGPNLS